MIIVEKLANLGGFMCMKTGQFSAANTTLQQEQGLTEDTPEPYEEEIKKFANLNGVGLNRLLDLQLCNKCYRSMGMGV